MQYIKPLAGLTLSCYIIYGRSLAQPIEWLDVVQFDNWICRLAESCTANASPENFILRQPDSGVVLGDRGYADCTCDIAGS